MADRLGWLEVAAEVLADRERLDTFATTASADGLTHVVVMGMGGSSLFPEVLARTFPPAGGRLRAAGARHHRPRRDRPHRRRVPDRRDAVPRLVEVRIDHRDPQPPRDFWARSGRPEQFAVVTDPGSELAQLGGRARLPRASSRTAPTSAAATRRCRTSGSCRPRWPVSTGPAPRTASLDGSTACAAADPAERRAPARGDPRRGRAGRPGQAHARHRPGRSRRSGCGSSSSSPSRPASTGTGRHPDRRRAARPARRSTATTASSWPSASHRRPRRRWPTPAIRWSSSRSATRSTSAARCSCGSWPRRSAAPCSGINPFDQPNVAEAKEATNDGAARSGPPAIAVEPLGDAARPGPARATTSPSRPTSIPETAVVDALEEARIALRDRLRVATTVGIGPRFLHSTGQLHKGGPPTGVFVQVRRRRPRRRRRSPARPSPSRTSSRRRPTATCSTLRATACAPARVALDDLVEVSR